MFSGFGLLLWVFIFYYILGKGKMFSIHQTARCIIYDEITNEPTMASVKQG